VRLQYNDPAFRQQVESELGTLLEQTNATLSHYEKLQMMVITSEVWTMENGHLTPTMKIKRSRIEDEAASRLKAWYANPAKIQWG
jgi:long-chain acyl-CoA synthetase